MADIVGSGRVVAPAALGVVAQIATAALPPQSQPGPKEHFDIVVHASVSGNAAADTDNMQLVNGATVLVSPLPQGVSAADVATTYRDQAIDPTQPIQVQAIGIGTAAIVYEATIEATRVS